MKIEDLIIEVPEMDGCQTELGIQWAFRKKYDKWKAQSERINAMLRTAVVADHDLEYKMEKRGIFIPIEEPDSMEAVIKELASGSGLETMNKRSELMVRARALQEKAGKG